LLPHLRPAEKQSRFRPWLSYIVPFISNTHTCIYIYYNNYVYIYIYIEIYNNNNNRYIHMYIYIYTHPYPILFYSHFSSDPIYEHRNSHGRSLLVFVQAREVGAQRPRRTQRVQRPKSDRNRTVRNGGIRAVCFFMVKTMVVSLQAMVI
jgi:hypothetical protein